MARAMTGLVRHLRMCAALLCACLASCGFADETPDYRYRLTVEVDTPEGLKTGSSVIEVRQSMGRSAMNPAGRKINRRVSGEAVAVDIAPGQTLFALLRSDNNVDWASYVMQMQAPKLAGEPWEERFDNMLLLEGEITLPRTWPPVGHLEERSAYPMLVTFADLNDPTSVALVDPEALAASFGEGVSLRRSTVAITEDPVTEGIEERLGWWDTVYEMGLSSEQFPENIPVGDFKGLFKKDRR